MIEYDDDTFTGEHSLSATSLQSNGSVSLKIGPLYLKNQILDYITTASLKSALQQLETKVLKKLTQTEKKIEEKVERTDNKVDDFIADHAMKRELDILAFADQSERHDFNSNLAKASSVLLTGNNTRCITSCLLDHIPMTDIHLTHIMPYL
jgi:hypothetical protein